MIDISVIIPVYNDSAGLKDTLNSLVIQDFPRENYEIIVADNGSADNTLDVAKEYADKYPQLIKYVVEEKIQSSYAARNKGLSIASGDVIAFVDNECITDEKWLKTGMSYFASGVATVAGQIKFTYKNENPNFWEYYDSARKLNQKSYVMNVGFGATANLFVRKKIFNRYGLFRDDLISGGDYEFGQRITKRNEKIVYGKNAVVFHKARSNFKSILTKSHRVATGQKDLKKLNLLEHRVITWRSFLPTKSAPDLKGYNIDLFKKIRFILVQNLFNYYNIFKRLF